MNLENDVWASIGTVKALLVWMYVGGYVTLARGEINAGLRALLSDKAGKTINQRRLGAEISLLPTSSCENLISKGKFPAPWGDSNIN